MNSKELLYSDDLKIYLEKSSIKDCNKLQCDLMNVAKWCEENNIVINVNKCKTVSFTKLKNKYNYTYAINGVQLNSTNSVKDLDILFDPHLTFNTHIVIMRNEVYRN